MEQFKLTFFEFYYLLKYYLFKLLLYNPQARELIVKKCSEDIIFWLEFFVKLPPSQNPESNQDLRGYAKGVSPFAHSLNGRVVGIEKFLVPETLIPLFKYQKDYILEIKSRIENGQPLVVQESINTGSQTCTALTLLWFWLYKEESNFFILGRVIKELYKTSDPHTTFMMYKYVLDHLPDCLFRTDTGDEVAKKEESPEPTNTQTPPITCNCSKQSETATELSNEKPANTQTNQQSQLKKDFRDPISPGEIFFKDAESNSTSIIKIVNVANTSGFVKGFALNMLLIGRQGGSDTLIPVKGSIEINKAESNLTSTIIVGKAGEASVCGNPFLKGLGKRKHKKEQTNLKPYKLLVNRKKKFLIKLVNTNNGNTISGFTAARRNYFPKHKPVKAVWLCNFAFHFYQTEHYTSLKNISTCLIVTSVPNGNANEFHSLSTTKLIDRYRLHWSLNPHYNEQWYNKILESMPYEVIHQFLNISYDHKLKRQRKTQTEEPVLQVAKKVEVVTSSVKSNRSSFYQTFTGSKFRQKKTYHKKLQYLFKPDEYEKLLSNLISEVYQDINFPSLGCNYSSKDLIFEKWQQMIKMLYYNNRLQLSSQKTALKLLYQFSSEFNELPLNKPLQSSLYTINPNIKIIYTNREMENLFPSLKYINRRMAEQALKAKNNRPKTEQEFIDEINAIAIYPYKQEPDKPALKPQNSHCEEQSDEAIQNKPVKQEPANTQPPIVPPTSPKPAQQNQNISPAQPPPQRFIPRTTKFIIKIVPPKKKNTDNKSPNTNNKNAEEPDKPP